MNDFVQNTSPKLLTLSAVAVGYILLGDFDSNEQNALGNWLMLIAQILCTNAYFNQLQNNGFNGNTSTKSFNNYDETINMLKRIVNALNKEIDNLKNISN